MTVLKIKVITVLPSSKQEGNIL